MSTESDIQRILSRLEPLEDRVGALASSANALRSDVKDLRLWVESLDDAEEPEEPPVDPEEPEDPGHPAAGWAFGLANVLGGTSGKGIEVVPNQVFRDTRWMRTPNRRYVNVRIEGTAATDSEDIADNVQLVNFVFADNKGHSVSDSGMKYILYLNPGRQEKKSGLVMLNGQVVNCSGTEFLEDKGHDFKGANIDFSRSPGITGGIRIRFGTQVQLLNMSGLKYITGRGHHSAVLNCPRTTVRLWSGNLDGDIRNWLSQQKEGKGKYQRAQCWYVAGCKHVEVGRPTTKQDTMPALNNIVAPGQSFKEFVAKGTQKKALGSFKELLALKVA
jgi:hypothetical protein